VGYACRAIWRLPMAPIALLIARCRAVGLCQRPVGVPVVRGCGPSNSCLHLPLSTSFNILRPAPLRSN